MKLMCCEHPIRVYNKYINEYLWTSCGKCNSCRNARAARWSQRCETERKRSKFTFFVTLTYRESCLPKFNLDGGFHAGLRPSIDELHGMSLVSTKHSKDGSLDFDSLVMDKQADIDLFLDLLQNDGIPYGSKTDIQLFHKRLNKFFFQNVTHTYKNFRYFIASELGSTTLRPHFHALYFVNDSDVASRFKEAILSSWKFGLSDVQYVEGTACSYVAQYVNKPSSLPSFYRASELQPFYFFSKNPTIGSEDGFDVFGGMPQYSESVKEIFNKCLVSKIDTGKADYGEITVVPIGKSVESRLFPKCPFYSEISSTLRAQFYSISSRFPSRTFKGFFIKIKEWLVSSFDMIHNTGQDVYQYILNKLDHCSESGVNWLKRLYYLSRKVCKLCYTFGISISQFVEKADIYWNKKELYLLKQMYSFQQDVLGHGDASLEDIALMYPEYLRLQGFTIDEYVEMFNPPLVQQMKDDGALYAFSNKKTHYKNSYLDSLRDKGKPLYNILNKFYHAKECNETIEALTA